jgi:hypothetical protein
LLRNKKVSQEEYARKIEGIIKWKYL